MRKYLLVIRKILIKIIGVYSVSVEIDRMSKQINRQTQIIASYLLYNDRRMNDLLIYLSKNKLFDIPQFTLKTDFPVAYDSADHIAPKGTANDVTRCPRFVKKIEELFNKEISYLDIGCSGGGIVFDFLQNGHRSFGVEGSDFSIKNQRANWAIIPEYLATCDATHPFEVICSQTENVHTFKVIGAWEVLEHIAEDRIPQLLKNVKLHMNEDSIFVASVATFEDFDIETGEIYHVTIKPKSWWKDILEGSGLRVIEDDLFDILDFPRGSGNGPDDWNAKSDPDKGFHLVAKIR